MSGKRVLVIDDERTCATCFRSCSTKPAMSLKRLQTGGRSGEDEQDGVLIFVLCDLRMPKMDGMAFLKTAHEKYPEKTSS